MVMDIETDMCEHWIKEAI